MRWFCSFKAYGDLVIACYGLRKSDPKLNGLLAGSHLSALLNNIEFNGVSRIIEVGNSVPAFFDTQKCGYINAIRNGFLLRKKIHASGLNCDDTLIFDALGLRQSFLAWPFHTEAITRNAKNIYLDYAKYLGLNESANDFDFNKRDKSTGNVYVFPDSRLKYKELTDCLINRIDKVNTKCGKKTILVKVGQSVPLMQFNSLQVIWVDGFDQLMTQVRNADIVVSADSLPAHLSEYLGTPVFVFTPIPNDYWMPLSSFNGQGYSGFDSLDLYKSWIEKI